jgi:hypothetical protein
MRRFISSGKGDRGVEVRGRNAVVEGRQGAHRGGGRVALDDHQVGRSLGEQGLELAQAPRRQLGEALPVPHHVGLQVGLEAVQVEDVLEDLAVLPGRQHHGIHVRTLLGREHHRGELDRLGARPHDDERAGHVTC